MWRVERQENILGKMVTAIQKEKNRDFTLKYVLWKPEYDCDREFLKVIRQEFAEELAQTRQVINFYWSNNEDNRIIKIKKNKLSLDIPRCCYGIRIEQKMDLPFAIRIQNKTVIFMEELSELERKSCEDQMFFAEVSSMLEEPDWVGIARTIGDNFHRK